MSAFWNIPLSKSIDRKSLSSLFLWNRNQSPFWKIKVQVSLTAAGMQKSAKVQRARLSLLCSQHTYTELERNPTLARWLQLNTTLYLWIQTFNTQQENTEIDPADCYLRQRGTTQPILIQTVPIVDWLPKIHIAHFHSEPTLASRTRKPSRIWSDNF